MLQCFHCMLSCLHSKFTATSSSILSFLGPQTASGMLFKCSVPVLTSADGSNVLSSSKAYSPFPATPSTGLGGVGVFVMGTVASVNYVCLHCVEPSLRPLSMAISTVAIHIFGNVPSSPLFGVVQDHIDSWRKTALILTSVLFLVAAIWFMDGVLFVFGRVEGASELHGNLLYGLEGADVMPQLKGKELLEFYSKNFQIRQVDVDEDPPDPIVSVVLV
ncbi:hypothetical protein DY000_02034160 [Brassica cretica]|uniref:Uncharacterized protein n=1 Tax=Brassica cretica TaxID=69181 RepID=A0ABQ7DPI0_BRACR|nr:hypothetical protein DY000_02034160 [Brassica cretica]